MLWFHIKKAIYKNTIFRLFIIHQYFMHKSRLEAYTDAVIAIVITIMVLEFKIPTTYDRKALGEIMHLFLSYLLSFAFISIYRNNHHHLFQAVSKINGKVLRANNILLLLLSLIPFATSRMGESHFSSVPVMLYGIILLGCALFYTVLVRTLLGANGNDSALAKAIGWDFKGKLSIAIYIIGVILAYYYPSYAWYCYLAVAIIRLIPDKRIENILS